MGSFGVLAHQVSSNQSRIHRTIQLGAKHVGASWEKSSGQDQV